VKYGTLTRCCTGGNIWLKNWSEVNSEYGGNPHVGRYLGVYFGIGIGSAALVVLQTLILWIFCSIEVSLPCSHFDAFSARPCAGALSQIAVLVNVHEAGMKTLHRLA